MSKVWNAWPRSSKKISTTLLLSMSNSEFGLLKKLIVERAKRRGFSNRFSYNLGRRLKKKRELAFIKKNIEMSESTYESLSEAQFREHPLLDSLIENRRAKWLAPHKRKKIILLN